MNFKNFIYFFILFLFSCDSMKSINLYDSVEKKEDPFLSFPHKDIFTDKEFTGVYGTKVHPCKEITFDSINNFSGKNHLHVKWKKTKDCKWLGFGFKWDNFKPKNLLPIIENSALEFMIRSDSGEFFRVPIIFGLVDYSEKQCFSKINILGMEDGMVDEQWRKVTIPLSTFKYFKKGLNITNVKELRVQLINQGNFHLDDIKIVPHSHTYEVSKENFTRKYKSFPVNLGIENKYWWGVNEDYSSNFKFLTTLPINNINTANNNQVLPKVDVTSYLSVNYSSESKDKKWNSFGFPFNRWEFADLSELYSTSVLYFKIRAEKVPSIKINLVSYGGKSKIISKIIQDNNIIQCSENRFNVYLPIKSFKNYNNIDWSKMKELRCKILKTSNFEIGDFKLLEFRGDPQNPKKWFKS